MSAVQEDPFDFWATAAAEFREMNPLPLRGAKEGDAIAWEFANVAAMFDEPSFARVMVDMGLRRVAVLRWGDIRWWQPRYFRAALGRTREEAATLNRFLRDSDIFAMRGAGPDVVPPPDLLLFVNRDIGAWRTASGGAIGDDIISLGAFCWRVTTGKAAARIARVCGYRSLPRVGDLANV